MAWQPYIILSETCFEKAQVFKVDPDYIFSLDKKDPDDTHSHQIHQFGSMEEFFEHLFNNHPNNSFFILTSKIDQVKKSLGQFDLLGKNLEILGNTSRELLVRDSLKKWLTEKMRFRFEGKVTPSRFSPADDDWQKVDQEGLYEFETQKNPWLSIKLPGT